MSYILQYFNIFCEGVNLKAIKVRFKLIHCSYETRGISEVAFA